MSDSASVVPQVHSLTNRQAPTKRYTIETTTDLVGCPSCAAVVQLHDRRPVWVRDLPSAGGCWLALWSTPTRCGRPQSAEALRGLIHRATSPVTRGQCHLA